jgi:hypothetical protein
VALRQLRGRLEERAMTTKRGRIGRLQLSRSGPELARLSGLVSSLATSSDDELDAFHARLLGSPALDLAQLARARDLLDAVGEALVSAAEHRNDPGSQELWQRLDLAWNALFSAGAVLPGRATPRPPPAATSAPRDTLPPHARAALQALEEREALAGAGSPSATVPLGPSGTIDAGPAPLVGRPSAPPSQTAASSSTPPGPAPSGSAQGKPSRSEVGRLIGATTQVDYTKKVDPAELPFVQAVRLAGAMATARGPAPSSPPPAAVLPNAPPTPPLLALPPHLARLSVEQFATYCAQCAATPEGITAIDERYGIESPAARAALEQHWHARLAADPALLSAWREHLQRAQRFANKPQR